MKKKKSKVKKKVKVAIYSFILLSILSIYTILNSNLFDLEHMEIQGNNVVTETDIMKMTSIKMNDNLFKYRLSKMESLIKKSPYVKDVNIKRKLPNKLSINITENTEDAIIESNNKYVYINRDGKILNEKDSITNENIPVVKNFEILEYNVGDKIKIKDESIKNRLLYLLECFNDNNLSREIDTISLEKYNLTMENKDGINILLKLDDDIAYNIKRLNKIIIDLKTKGRKRGSIDLRNKNQAIYSPL